MGPLTSQQTEVAESRERDYEQGAVARGEPRVRGLPRDLNCCPDGDPATTESHEEEDAMNPRFTKSR
jgi:hypothetical protein